VKARLLNRVSCGPLRSANLLACARLFMSSLFADLSETCSSETQVNPFPWKMVRLATGRGPWRLASSTSNPLEKASRFSQHSTPEPPRASLPLWRERGSALQSLPLPSAAQVPRFLGTRGLSTSIPVRQVGDIFQWRPQLPIQALPI
jgi:hypothetical protein